MNPELPFTWSLMASPNVRCWRDQQESAACVVCRVRQQVTQVLLRRAAAACDLGQLGEAAADYEEALRWLPAAAVMRVDD